MELTLKIWVQKGFRQKQKKTKIKVGYFFVFQLSRFMLSRNGEKLNSESPDGMNKKQTIEFC